MGQVERKAWHPVPAIKQGRVRGRAGQKARAAVIAEEPFCRTCLANGLSVGTDEVDHIKPLAWGGTDTRSNKQGLCKPCHEAKSKAERAETARRMKL